MSNNSLRELGGDGTQHKLEEVDAKFGKLMQRVVDSDPEVVADIALNTGHQLHDALRELIKRNILTSKQYDILGETLISRRDHGERNNVVLQKIVDKISADLTQQFYDALGWNIYPQDGEGPVDITV